MNRTRAERRASFIKHRNRRLRLYLSQQWRSTYRVEDGDLVIPIWQWVKLDKPYKRWMCVYDIMGSSKGTTTSVHDYHGVVKARKLRKVHKIMVKRAVYYEKVLSEWRYPIYKALSFRRCGAIEPEYNLRPYKRRGRRMNEYKKALIDEGL